MDPEKIDALVRERGESAFDRVFAMLENVRERMERACRALGDAKVPYAIVGGNAVAAWVATRDEGAIRTTQDVDILLRAEDFDAASAALSNTGFVADQVLDVPIFRDGPQGKPSQAIHIVWAGKKVRRDYLVPAPQPEQSREMDGKRVLDLLELIRMKLGSFRDRDRVHIRDLIGVGLVDATWLPALEPPLAERLQSLLDDPDG